jgi:flavin reductase (DIM6/NTAB) family NADH-FMN oxidoreductase RutF
MNITSEQEPYDEDEFANAGLTKGSSQFLRYPVPTVAESPIKFECGYHTTIRLPGNPPRGTVDIIIGKVVEIHIADDVLTDSLIDLSKVQPIARCGYYTYAVIRETFEMKPPGNGRMAYGLLGNAAKNSEQQEENVRSVVRSE